MTIIYPMFVLVLLTFGVGLGVGLSRMRSVKLGEVNPRYYKLMTGETPPEYVIKLGRNFSNLLEVPVLFYVAGALVVATGLGGAVMLGLAWAYVLLRVIHTAIHITYNNPLHRFMAFLASNFVLLVMWVVLVLMG